MKTTVELDDTLPDRTQSAIDDVKAELLRYLDENKPDTLPELGNDLDYSGAIHEIVDGSVPVYTYELDVAWFLHGSDLEAAYENAGVGDNPRENDGMAAVYFYIMDAVNEWYSDNAQDVFDTWQSEQPAS
jgi:hypothetical protein